VLSLVNFRILHVVVKIKIKFELKIYNIGLIFFWKHLSLTVIKNCLYVYICYVYGYSQHCNSSILICYVYGYSQHCNSSILICYVYGYSQHCNLGILYVYIYYVYGYSQHCNLGILIYYVYGYSQHCNLGILIYYVYGYSQHCNSDILINPTFTIFTQIAAGKEVSWSWWLADASPAFNDSLVGLSGRQGKFSGESATWLQIQICRHP